MVTMNDNAEAKMYYAEVMERREMATQSTGNGGPFPVGQPVVQRNDPNPVVHTLMVLVFVGLLIGLTVLSAVSRDAAKSNARHSPRQMPMVHMDR